MPRHYRKRVPISYRRVKELFDYHPDGYLIWKVSPSNSVPAGSIAGHTCKDTNYINVRVDGNTYKMHRLIYVWHHGYNPEREVDHKDQDTTNNKIDNLREVSQSCNIHNSKLRKDSTTGVKGVFWDYSTGKGFAHIRVNYVKERLGTFTKFEDAVMARYRRELELGICDSNSSARKYLIDNGLLPVRS